MAAPYRQRTRQFSVYLSDAEMERLESKRAIAQMSKSEFIRHMILFGSAHERTYFSREDSHNLCYEINRIGNNINQIAYYSNANRGIDADDFQSLFSCYMELLTAYDEFFRDLAYCNK